MKKPLSALAFAVGVCCLAGCASTGSSDGKAAAEEPAAAQPASTKQQQPASTKQQPASAKQQQPAAAPRAGMDAKGNVIDPAKVEAGSGRTVKGINDYEGEITGNPVPGSKFDKLQIGMSMGQVQSIVGPPTDQGAYITGKAWIPFYFGGDRHRYEFTYKGKGRLIFAGGGMGDMSGHLIWIIHSANEPGFR